MSSGRPAVPPARGQRAPGRRCRPPARPASRSALRAARPPRPPRSGARPAPPSPASRAARRPVHGPSCSPGTAARRRGIPVREGPAVRRGAGRAVAEPCQQCAQDAAFHVGRHEKRLGLVGNTAVEHREDARVLQRRQQRKLAGVSGRGCLAHVAMASPEHNALRPVGHGRRQPTLWSQSTSGPEVDTGVDDRCAASRSASRGNDTERGEVGLETAGVPGQQGPTLDGGVRSDEEVGQHLPLAAAAPAV